MDNGWIKLHRKLEKWEWYQDSKTFHLFIHLILQANHQPKKWRGIMIERGQFITGLHSLKSQTGISIQSTRTSLERLKSTSEITIKTTNKYSIVTICKYNEYQDDKREINKQTNKLTNKQLTNNQQQPIIKELNKEEDTMSGKPDFVAEVIKFLNLSVRKNYKLNTPKTKALIASRVKEGFTLDNFKTVIAKKSLEWAGDAKMEKYLRPETLFGTKFESYLNQNAEPVPSPLSGYANFSFKKVAGGTDDK